MAGGGDAKYVGALAHQDDPRVAILAVCPFIVVWSINLYVQRNNLRPLIMLLLATSALLLGAGGARSLVYQFLPLRLVVARRQSPDIPARSTKPAWRERFIDTDHLVPRLNVVIMVTGTHGDVAPFVALGLELKRRYGHRIRLATHETHREFVARRGLEFYPLAGDPKVLSQWMVQSEGRLLPNLMAPIKELERELLELVPKKVAMVNAIMESTWWACVDSVPDGSPPFVAHAIISNPVAYGHIHCASALNIPLHMAFPQPWTPTEEYPHPFMIPSSGMAAPDSIFARMANKRTYYVFDELTWMGLNANSWRTDELHLGPLLFADRGAHLLNDLEVPFAYMWSPAFVPKPHDWGPHVDVVGALVHDTGAAAAVDASEELLEFLANGDPPIFIGFGSMVIDNPEELFDMIVEAACDADARVLVQSSWSKLGGSGDAVPENVCLVGSCSHSWLMPQCCAVIHHGGAGTVAAGLRFGLPTFVVPFFGDQHFWGEMILRAGAGPAPCPYAQLTSSRLAEAFETLQSPSARQKAHELSRRMQAEEGVANMCNAFTRHLPLETMLCMVSLFADTEPRVVVAEKWHSKPDFPISAEAHAALQASRLRTRFFMDYGYILWDAHAAAYVGHNLAMIPLNMAHKFKELGSVLFSPLLDVHEVISEFKRTSGRTYCNLVLTSLITFVQAVLELPMRVLGKLFGLFFFAVTSLVQLVLSCCCCRSGWRNVVQVRARHPGIRPAFDAAKLPKPRRESLVRAAIVAEHVLAVVAMVQGRRRGNLKPWLPREQVIEILAVLMHCPPPRKASSYQPEYLGAFRRHWAWSFRNCAELRPRVEKVLHGRVGMDGTSLADFCLMYGQWSHAVEGSAVAEPRGTDVGASLIAHT